MKPRVANIPLAQLMDRHTAVGAAELCHAEGDRIRCVACGHRCLVGEGQRGICKARFNDHGQLKVPFGYVAGLQCDPVEKKPFFHVHPGSDALTFGMLGCDYHCGFCQNWITSQSLRDPTAEGSLRPVSPSQLVEFGRREGANLVVSSYNEPLITAEWAVSVFREARASGLDCAFVSNGNATPEVLDYLRPWLVAYKVDLKGFDDRRYRTLGGTLDAVTRTIQMIHERGLWLEVVTLIIPGFNDGDDELRRAARFLASVSRDIPWHLTAFHKDYKLTDPDPTPPETLVRAAMIGHEEGLRFVYCGNLPGRVGAWENTTCPDCGMTLIERTGYLVRSYRLTADGRCPGCGAKIPGVWPSSPDAVRTGHDMTSYRARQPRPVATKVIPLGTINRPPRGDQTMSSPLSGDQRQQLLQSTAAMLRAAADGHAVQVPADLSVLRDLPVAGAFVCLKRGRHLRACCGSLGQTATLASVLESAVARTVREDMRFPPVSPTELHHLELEVWLLSGPQPVKESGPERLKAITVGKHGVRVVRGQAHALFLPAVAEESGWDAEQLLDHVCMKAELPPTAWRDDATALFTFEGDPVRCRLASLGVGASAPPPGICRPQDVAAYAGFALRNIIALLSGATASPYFWGAPDGDVNGLVMSLRRPGTTQVFNQFQLSLRPGVPLQTTLYAVTEHMARNLAANGVTAVTMSAAHVALAFLHDPMLHGTVADARLEGLSPNRRAVLVLERNKSALAFDVNRSAEELVAEAASAARVSQPQTAAVYSLEVLSNSSSMTVANVPRAVRGPAERPPAVAGSFYDGDPEALGRTVEKLLGGERNPEPWAAALVPHAGLRFSGQVVADVLRRVKIPRTVIVIGPKHTPHGVDWAVAPHETWQLPGGGVASDFMTARRLCQAIPGLEMDAAAHAREHAVEVELPLIARLAPEARVVGVAIGHADLEGCKRFAEGLAGFLRQSNDPPLLLISSDMNHFATDAESRRLDELAMAAMERRDPEGLYQTVRRYNISMCGVLPAVIVLQTLRSLGRLRKAERVGYATTADVTGDTSRVVGYAGMVFGG